MKERFRFCRTPLDGLTVIERLAIADPRGYLERLFCAEEFSEIGLKQAIAQINRTLTRRRGTVRGMHFQHPPHSETKIISCLHGEIYDVSVDLRAGSPTLLQWHGEILSGENNISLLIPEGFAHGFQTLSDDCELLYFHSAAYQVHAEGGISPFDSLIGIEWPLSVGEISERDRSHAPLTAGFKGISP